MAKRKFIENYIQYGFTPFLENREGKGQCVLCCNVFGHHSLRPSKLKLHLQKLDPDYEDKDVFLNQIDIFDQLNRLNLKLQRRDTTELDFVDALNAFMEKLENWKQKIESGNVAMLEALSSMIVETLKDPNQKSRPRVNYNLVIVCLLVTYLPMYDPTPRRTLSTENELHKE
ncbi:uncharacterized protein LOC120331126 [Styela clava]|uniref:uncharacterized protein LOC120331126 n=1 Tax=Styela clava TaxID=7725 RepID=UPI00193A814F|nr:uncharacterized protein LOC120331126 [Styela clava]